ncbi:MAG: RNA polymerase sigma factor [bacterium]
MTPEEEKTLVAKAAKGDEAAFEALVRANERLVYAAARKLTGDAEEALDVAQEAFLRAWRHLEKYRGEARFGVWLYRLTYNCAMDAIRKRRETLSLDADEEEGGALPEMADEAPLPEETVLREEQRREVREAIAALDPEKREILVLRELNGLSYEEIGHALGLEAGTVKSRISRARAALAEILVKRGTFSTGKPSNRQKGGRTQ